MEVKGICCVQLLHIQNNYLTCYNKRLKNVGQQIIYNHDTDCNIFNQSIKAVVNQMTNLRSDLSYQIKTETIKPIKAPSHIMLLH